MVGSGVLGTWAVIWLTRIPPLPDCEAVTPKSSANERLICAQANMQSSQARELAHAVQLTANWSNAHPLYPEAYPVLVEASQRLLKRARQTMHQGDLATAIEWAQQIPLDTPLRSTAQAEIWNWQQDWKAGQVSEGQIQEAIAAQDWATADGTLQDLKQRSSDYWVRQRYTELQQAKQREQQAWAQVTQAQTLASSGDPEQLGQALTLAQRVDLTSQAWTEAQKDINRWSQNLLLYSFQRWELGDIDGAIAAVQKVPPDPSLAPEARDLIQFSHAKRLAENAQQKTPSYIQLFQLMEAIRAAEDISPDSTFYDAAQQSLREWQVHLEDLRTLQLARVVAGTRQGWGYRYAARLAWTVETDRPRRLQAQTLIAQWEDEVERIEDRPYLQQAQTLAQKGTIAALEAAIAQARNIQLGRALRIDAQTVIAAWTNQIEVIQDQPTLNEANRLAGEGNLPEAITVAQQIDDTRALYDQAQAMINDWTQTLEVEADSPILEEAKSLAYKGSLTRAINLAAQIAPGRALYDEAQTAIAIWKAERAYIWATQADDEETGNDDSEATDTADPRSEQPSQPPPPSRSTTR